MTPCRLLMLCALLLLAGQVETTNDTVADHRTELWLLGLFPFSGPWPGGLGQLPAVLMGIEDVNNDPTILPGYKLRMTVDNTACDAGVGTNALYEQLYKPTTKLMVVGAGCSAVSQATAIASHLWNLVQLSYSSASPALSDKSMYKKFYRVFPPESSFNPAKISLLRAFDWNKVGTLTESQVELFALTTSDFLQKAPSHGIEVLTSESFSIDPREQVRNLKRHSVRIIVGNFYENKARVIFCEAYKKKMYGPKYAWIITGFFSRLWWKNVDPDNPHDCSIEQLEEAIQGYFTADANPNSLSQAPGISGKTYDQFATEYSNRTGYSNKTGYGEAPYGYDSVWAIASMLNRSQQEMELNVWNRSLENFSYQDTEMANLFLRVMNSTQFQGVSGPVMFDEKGDRRGLTQIEQLQDNTEVRVGVYDPSVRGELVRWEPGRPIRWIGGRPPPDSITEKIVPKVISTNLFFAMTSLAVLGIVMSLIFLVFNIRYRHRRYIKMSSPNLNNVILLGAIFAFIAIILCGIDTNLVSLEGSLITCKCYNWTLSLGFSLAFGAMFSKTWRVHKIFTNKQMQRMVIKDFQLLAIVCIQVGLDVVVFSAWEALDPLQIVFFDRPLEQVTDPDNDNQVLVPQSRYCESENMWYFTGILYAIKGLLLLFGAFIAFETRKVTVPALNDSKLIGISLYNVVILCLIGVPVALMMKDEVDACYTLISIFVFFATTLTICLLFIPKIINRNKHPKPGTMKIKSHESATTSTGFSDIEAEDIARLREDNENLKTSLREVSTWCGSNFLLDDEESGINI
ncbi:hypothetical protein NP493_966g00017 [Ridgeia piscesae]|uniref:Gamma-aminobutyric acid type B receptor subunit 2 n=1 Tax=Ridgeia piscesae TaxID=27915 RepID=A0AAD9KL67_RIDPI|nr:hypothetical protein NP493_966g00017 [Ridgeia piscesae]